MAIGLVIWIIIEKVCQKVEHFSEMGVKKWSTFSKGVPKSGAIFQKMCQKVEYFSQKCVNKWRTYNNIRGVRGLCP